MIEFNEFALSGIRHKVPLYPYIALAHDGNVDLSRISSIVTWLARFKVLPRYVSMPGM